MAQENVYTPQAPDYADTTMWNRHLNDSTNTGVDVFYMVSTWELDWTTADGKQVSHWADPVGQKAHRDHMATEINRAANNYMADGNNFYSPYYRHITLEGYMTYNEDTIAQRYYPIAFADIQRAFRYYMDHYNHGRPFILAGFSQGAQSVRELLKTFTPEEYQQLVAAYVIGYKITAQDTLSPYIVPAKNATDVGVTICYNSVSDVKYNHKLISEGNVVCINPVNWRTDDTPARLNDSITVTLNTDHRVLVVKGYDGKGYHNVRNFINVGDYHGAEPWLYQDCIKQNIKDRVKAYRKE